MAYGSIQVASGELMKTYGAAPERARRRQPRNVGLTPEDRETLLRAVARRARDENTAWRYLRPIGFPRETLPAWTDNSETWWERIFDEFDLGRVANPYPVLISDLVRAYQADDELCSLYQRYVLDTESAGRQPGIAATPAAQARYCRVMVRARNEEERAAALADLRERGLDPQELWSTEYVTSYEVGATEPSLVRRALASADLGWTIVPPGQPDYVLRELFIQGPDGSHFRAVDTPALQTIRNLAEEVLTTHYDNNQDRAATVPTVIDRVGPDGQRQRTNPEQTLHEAGVGEGAQLRVGFEGRAGAINPVAREETLHRVCTEITDFARAYPGMVVRANSATLPTAYELEFDQDSFGPPTPGGHDAITIRHHVLRIELGPDFPEVAPRVYWLTPIFHPNVFPNYDSEPARQDPQLRGWVCLGELDDAWFPGVRFDDVCQTLVDIAGYRNYDLYRVTAIPDTEPQLRRNFVDPAAAEWAAHHQQEIRDLGGEVIERRRDIEPRMPRNVIYRLD
jgi:hypothetical protein